jgi:hypothetical protein
MRLDCRPHPLSLAVLHAVGVHTFGLRVDTEVQPLTGIEWEESAVGLIPVRQWGAPEPFTTVVPLADLDLPHYERVAQVGFGIDTRWRP